MHQRGPETEYRTPLTVVNVVERLGSELIVADDAGISSNRVITGVSVFDPLVELTASDGEALLAVGVDVASDQAVGVVERAAQLGYSAVIFHSDAALPPAPREAGAKGGIALMLSPTDVSWAHLAAMLRVGAAADRQFEVAGIALGDLFAFANQLASDIGGAVTIEDPQSRVLAYSQVEAHADNPRKETILGQQVPSKYIRVLQEQGVFRRLMSTDDVVHLDAVPALGLRRRVAISVRAAGETLGTIWIAEAGHPLQPDAPNILREAAKTAALHIVRDHLALYHQSTLRRALARELLDGSDSPDVLAVRLGLAHEGAYSILGFEAVTSPGKPVQLLQALEAYCSTFRLDALCVDAGPRVYCVLPARRRSAADLLRLADDAGRRAGTAVRAKVVAGVGLDAASANLMPRSRVSVDRVLRVLLLDGGDRVVASVEEVQAEAGLLEVLDIMRQRPHLLNGKLQTLIAESTDKNTALLQTLRAYLDSMGNVAVAADLLHIHPNTLRYRLNRALDLTHLNLSEPSEVLMAALRLRLL